MEQHPAAASPGRRRAPRVLAAAVGAAALLLAGCSDDEPAPPATATVEGDPGSDLRYVALGDSFTAAPGVPETSTETFCLRSDSNYPALVADELGVDLVDVSCSGATTEHMLTAQFWAGQRQPPQLEALTDEADLVTVSVGGNDFDLFGTLIGTCSELADLATSPDDAPCRTRMQAGGSDILLDQARQIRGRVARVVRAARERAPEAELLVVGYPQMVPDTGACSALPLAPGDYDYARAVNLALTRALEGAAADTDSPYIDVWQASEGHDICAPQPWINGAGLDATAMPFHPYPVEQEAVADLVVAEVEGRLLPRP
ncbi:SGNH/GDSL hydrolase family protein [Nocardioides ferulae]|uniref:SGNH/GDSL hydrolase family protein n=1 Tax=Nocardioides ferulae TaxID=2340821 RepID=UPI000EAE1A61|nr:SGNH/GDSL hydrolase family protein [Nocardioides ferulae]